MEEGKMHQGKVGNSSRVHGQQTTSLPVWTMAGMCDLTDPPIAGQRHTERQAGSQRGRSHRKRKWSLLPRPRRFKGHMHARTHTAICFMSIWLWVSFCPWLPSSPPTNYKKEEEGSNCDWQLSEAARAVIWPPSLILHVFGRCSLHLQNQLHKKQLHTRTHTLRHINTDLCTFEPTIMRDKPSAAYFCECVVSFGISLCGHCSTECTKKETGVEGQRESESEKERNRERVVGGGKEEKEREVNTVWTPFLVILLLVTSVQDALPGWPGNMLILPAISLNVFIFSCCYLLSQSKCSVNVKKIHS